MRGSTKVSLSEDLKKYLKRPIMTNGNNSADTGQGNDAVKIDKARRLTRRLKAWKTAVTLDVSNCIKKLEYFEANYECDLTPTGNQIELAIDILNTHYLAKARFKC